MRTISKEHREKIGAAKTRWWTNRTPEELAAVTAKRRATFQIKRIREGKQRPVSLGHPWIDPDFDEGL